MAFGAECHGLPLLSVEEASSSILTASLTPSSEAELGEGGVSCVARRGWDLVREWEVVGKRVWERED